MQIESSRSTEELRFARGNAAAVLSSNANENYCSTPAGRRKEGGKGEQSEKEREAGGARGRRKGKERKLINSNHRALIPQRAKDRPARLRLTALATAPFVTRGEKPRNRTCVRNGDSQRDFSRLDFPGFPPTEKNVYGFSQRIALREMRTPPSSLRRRSWHEGGAIEIFFQHFSGDTEETKRIGGKLARGKITINRKRKEKRGREHVYVCVYSFFYFRDILNLKVVLRIFKENIKCCMNPT